MADGQSVVLRNYEDIPKVVKAINQIMHSCGCSCKPYEARRDSWDWDLINGSMAHAEYMARDKVLVGTPNEYLAGKVEILDREGKVCNQNHGPSFYCEKVDFALCRLAHRFMTNFRGKRLPERFYEVWEKANKFGVGLATRIDASGEEIFFVQRFYVPEELRVKNSEPLRETVA